MLSCPAGLLESIITNNDTECDKITTGRFRNASPDIYSSDINIAVRCMGFAQLCGTISLADSSGSNPTSSIQRYLQRPPTPIAGSSRSPLNCVGRFLSWAEMQENDH
jgi:hypothetical protein